MDRKAKVLPNHTIAYPMFKKAIEKLLQSISTGQPTIFLKFKEPNYFFFFIQIDTIMNFLKPFPISLKLYFLFLPSFFFSFFHFFLSSLSLSRLRWPAYGIYEDCSSPGEGVLSGTPVDEFKMHVVARFRNAVRTDQIS
jgi:hypothetical protein